MRALWVALFAALVCGVGYSLLPTGEPVPVVVVDEPVAPTVEAVSPEQRRREVEGGEPLTLAGRVVDAEGLGVRTKLRFRTRFAPHQVVEVESGDDGAFRSTRRLESAVYSVELVDEPAWRLDDDTLVDAPAADILVRVMQTSVPDGVRARGRVTDPAEAPIAGARIIGPDGQVVRTAADGSFEVAFDGAVRVEATGFTGRRAVSLRAEHENLITLEPGLPIELRVVAASDRSPVEAFAVRMRPAEALDPEIDALRLSGRHEDGRVKVTGLWPGENLLAVVPTDPLWAPPATLRLDPRDTPRVEVELTRREPLEITTRWENGEPADGLRVQLIDAPRTSAKYALDPRLRTLGCWSRITRHAPTIVSRAVTDENGRAILGIPATSRRLIARAWVEPEDRRAQEPSHVDELLSIPPASSVAIELPTPLRLLPRARLTGGLLGLETLPPDWELTVASRRGSRRVVVVDGSYSIDDLPPGPTSFELHARKREANGRWTRIDHVELGTVDLDPGEHGHHDFRCPTPTRLDGVVTLLGEPARGTVTIREYPLSRDGAFSVELDASGRFTTEPRWMERVLIRLESATERPLPLWDQAGPRTVRELEATPGQGFVRIDLEHRTVAFHVRDHAGAPVAGTRFVASCGPISQWLTTDERGHATVEFVPRSARIQLWRTWRKTQRLASVVVTPARAHYTVDARVPAEPPRDR